MLKRKEFLRKKRQMLVNEDYYDPASFTPLDVDCDMGSPFNELLENESIPVDMDIEDSCDPDEEVELRNILIDSMSKRKDELRVPSPDPKLVAKQDLLKQAVLRLQQKTSNEALMSERNESPVSNVVIEEVRENSQMSVDNSGSEQLPAANITLESSRLITSFESVTKPVERMVINLDTLSDSDDATTENSSKLKKPDSFAKNLDSFLKTIRFRHERKDETPTSSITAIAEVSAKTVVSGLSKASQKEYHELIQKIKILEEAKRSRLKTREEKRTKSSSEKSAILPTAESSLNAKSQDLKKANAMEESLNKISSLDRESQLRLIAKAEKNYLLKKVNLLNSFEQNMEFLQAKELERDIGRKELLKNKISEIEQLLKRHRDHLVKINTKIKINSQKIIQVQRTLIKNYSHAANFGSTCQKIGQKIHGNHYKLEFLLFER